MQPLDRPCVHEARLVELLLCFGIEPPDQSSAIRAEVLPVAHFATAEFNRIHRVYDWFVHLGLKCSCSSGSRNCPAYSGKRLVALTEIKCCNSASGKIEVIQWVFTKLIQSLKPLASVWRPPNADCLPLVRISPHPWRTFLDLTKARMEKSCFYISWRPSGLFLNHGESS